MTFFKGSTNKNIDSIQLQASEKLNPKCFTYGLEINYGRHASKCDLNCHARATVISINLKRARTRLHVSFYGLSKRATKTAIVDRTRLTASRIKPFHTRVPHVVGIVRKNYNPNLYLSKSETSDFGTNPIDEDEYATETKRETFQKLVLVLCCISLL